LHSALTVAGAIAVISGFSLAAVGGIFLLTPLLPLVFTVWAWRAGTDANERGLRVRAGFGARFIPWTEVTAFAVGRRQPVLGFLTGRRAKVVATLANGRDVTLTAVRPADLRTLVAASGQPLTRQTAAVAA
jgi:hypothetical protein